MKKGLMLIVLLLIAIPGVFAADTEINVRAPQDTRVSIFILEAGDEYGLLESYHGDSVYGGAVKYTYSGSEKQIKVNVKVKEAETGIQLLLERFGDFDAGEPLFLQAIPGNISNDYMEVQRQIEEEEAAAAAVVAAAKKAADDATAKKVAEEEAAAEAARIAEEATLSYKLKSITGKISFGSLGEVSKKTYYIIGGFLLVAVLGFMMMKHGMPSMPSFGGGNLDSLKANLSREEDKIKEIRSKMAKIRGDKSDRIKKMEDKLKADEEELKQLVGKKKEVAKEKIEDKKDDIEDAKEKEEKKDEDN
jgi:gas vesicle protein